MSEPWHLGMMCAFDVESTGTDTEAARMVTACIAYVDGSGKIPPESQTWLIDPGVDIPPDAARIHGITTEHAREHGQPAAAAVRDIAGELLRSAAAGIPVIAFNAAYDLTVLDRESRRHGLDPFGPELEAAKGVVVDPWVMDKALDPYRKGSRKLTAVCEHYGVRLDNAHDAASDAIAAARVAWKIASIHGHVARMSATELHAWQVKERRSQARSLREHFRKQGSNEPVDDSWPLRAWSTEEAA